MNHGGASDRPSLPELWDNVQAKIRGEKPKHDVYKKWIIKGDKYPILE